MNNSVKLLLVWAILLFTASCKQHSPRFKDYKGPPGIRIKNPDEKGKVVFPCDNDKLHTMDWFGDYATTNDTLVGIDPKSLREFQIVKWRCVRFGKWTLEDDNGNIYTEVIYKNDTPESIHKILPYPEGCNMDSIHTFTTGDTISVTVFY